MKKIAMENCKYDDLITIPFTSGSDYSGSPVEFCNYKLLKTKFSKTKGVYAIYGGYSTFEIAYNPDEVTEKTKKRINEIIKDLKKYPCIDDEYLTNYELSIIKSNIKESYSDFRNICKKEHILFNDKNMSDIAYNFLNEFGFSSPFQIDYNDTDLYQFIINLNLEKYKRYTIGV